MIFNDIALNLFLFYRVIKRKTNCQDWNPKQSHFDVTIVTLAHTTGSSEQESIFSLLIKSRYLLYVLISCLIEGEFKFYFFTREFYHILFLLSQFSEYGNWWI